MDMVPVVSECCKDDDQSQWEKALKHLNRSSFWGLQIVYTQDGRMDFDAIYTPKDAVPRKDVPFGVVNQNFTPLFFKNAILGPVFDATNFSPENSFKIGHAHL